MAVGVVSGRRRVGKSFLLRALCEARGGLYHVALEQDQRPALDRFARDIGAYAGAPAGLSFESWEGALTAAMDAISRRAPKGAGLLVLDELPYLLPHSGVIPSVLQTMYDTRRDMPRLRVILCGSSISVMSALLSGPRALRGRASLDMALPPFDYRTAASFWGLGDPEMALMVDALVGSSPGYRDIAGEAPPNRRGLQRWAARTFMNPSHALYREDEYLLHEEPRITSSALYFSILGAIAAGASTPTRIGAITGRAATALTEPLKVLERAGFVIGDHDLLQQRRPHWGLADPIMRTLRLLVRPHHAELELRRFDEVWPQLQATIGSQIVGPHFEQLAREWVRRFAEPGATGGRIGAVGRTVINDVQGHTRHEIDVLALAAGEPPRSFPARILVIGEAKASISPRGTQDLRRLDRVRGLLSARGHRAEDAHLHVYARSGFTPALQREAGARPDVELVDLERMYNGS